MSPEAQCRNRQRLPKLALAAAAMLVVALVGAWAINYYGRPPAVRLIRQLEQIIQKQGDLELLYSRGEVGLDEYNERSRALQEQLGEVQQAASELAKERK